MSDQGPEYPKYPDAGSNDGPGSAPPPPPSGGAPAPPTQPGSVATAVKLMYVGAALSLLSVVVSFFTLDTIKDTVADAIRESDPDATQGMIDTAYTVTLFMTVVMGLIAVGLWLWMAWKNGQGRSWARIVATVFAGLNVLFSLGSFTQPGITGVAAIFSVINILLAIVILVLLWKKESTAFYESVTQSRQLR